MVVCKRMEPLLCLIYISPSNDQQQQQQQQRRTMASGAGRSAAVALLMFNVFLYFIVIVISASVVNHGIEKSHATASTLSPPAQIFPMYYPLGNTATGFVVMFSLIAGVVGLTTCAMGVSNVVQSTGPSLNAAAASSLISWMLTMLAMGFGCKEINIGWTRADLRTLETMLILLSGTQLFCTIAIQMGIGIAHAVARDRDFY